MAIAATAVTNPAFQGDDIRQFNLTALDGDTTLTFNHGLIFTPTYWSFGPVNGAAFALGTWGVSSVTATQVTITKANAVGSGTGIANIAVLTLGRFPRPQNER